MSANAIQVSGKATNGIIFLVGGDDYDSFYANLLTVNGGDAGATDATLAKLRDLVNVNGQPAVTGQQAVQNVQNAFPQAQPAPPAPHGQQAPSCAHGVREWKAGTSKAGKAYKMWSCPSQDRSTQCEPVWVR